MISEGEALTIAKEYAKQRGWQWLVPVNIDRRNHWWGPLYSYCIFTNASCRGLNIMLEIEAKSGNIVKGGFNPR